MRRICFINRFFFPDNSATSQLLSDLCFNLVDKGFAIDVITSRQMYENARAQLAHRENIRGVKIFRVWTTRFGRKNLILRAIDYLTFYISATLQCFFLLSKNHVVVCKTDPPMISVIGWLTGWLKGAKVINWIQDLFPEVVVAANSAQFIPFISTGYALRNMSLRESAVSVVIGESMKQRLIAEGMPAESIRVIHNWANGKSILPTERAVNPLTERWGLSKKFVVGYSGNMGRVHEFDTLLGAIDRLKNRSDIVFLFIGGGAHREYVVQRVKDAGWKNVMFQPYQPQENLAYSLSLPDVHVISLRPEFEGLIVPSKFYGIAAAGRGAIYIGGIEGEIPNILHQNNCGSVVEIGDVDNLVQTLMELAAKPEQVGIWGLNARRCFDENFSSEKAFLAWEAVLQEASVV